MKPHSGGSRPQLLDSLVTQMQGSPAAETTCLGPSSWVSRGSGVGRASASCFQHNSSSGCPGASVLYFLGVIPRGLTQNLLLPVVLYALKSLY